MHTCVQVLQSVALACGRVSQLAPALSMARREGMQEEGRPLSTCGGPQNESADNSMAVM